MNRATANLVLLSVAAIWGAAFVAQSTAMGAMSPSWFNALRFALTIAAMVPFLVVEARRATRPIEASDWTLMGINALVFAASTQLQQTALVTATVTNAGFLTSLYIVLTPLAAFLILRERPAARVIPAVGLGISGAWFLSGGVHGLGASDALLMASAVGWAVQMVLLGRVVQRTHRPILATSAQYLATVVLAGGYAIAADPISWAAIGASARELLFAGLVSAGIGYTLQGVAQRYTRAADAAIMLSCEAPFAAVFGVLLLGERLSLSAMIGCALIFAAVLVVELWPGLKKDAAI
jgi:drug/metabolite transporter (DMT)-like permease